MSSRLSANARREQLLDVALTTFARAGYHETSMNDVADAAGVTKPVLYQHFESKRELYQALLDTVGSRMVKAIRAATADVTSGRERTERGFRAYFRWVAANPEAFVLMYGGASRQDQEFAHGVRRVTDEAARAIAPLIRPARTAHGELEIRAGCDGDLLASVPLPASPAKDGFIDLDAKLPAQTASGDLCFVFTGDTRPAMWAIDNVRLIPRSK